MIAYSLVGTNDLKRAIAFFEALFAEVRGTVYARAKAQDAGFGLETELAELDGATVSAAAAAGEALEALQKALVALSRALEAEAEDGPTWRHHAGPAGCRTPPRSGPVASREGERGAARGRRSSGGSPGTARSACPRGSAGSTRASGRSRDRGGVRPRASRSPRRSPRDEVGRIAAR